MKAVCMFSGGLDSLLAIKLIQQQGIEIVAVSFRSPFFISEEKKKKLEKFAKEYNFEIHFIELGNDYLKMIKKPKHGYGRYMNPCIDCHAYMAKKAWEYGEKIGAKFIFTGEVLNERPMSQNKKALHIVERESGLKGKLLRPLSAKLLAETEAEKEGLVKREELLAISGRSRKPQIELAKKFGIKDYETPGGGCLLTYEGYSNKLRDLFLNKKKITLDEIRILKFGRHFRLGKNKIIVGRDEKDNEQLKSIKNKSDLIFEAKDCMSPVTLLQGPKTKKAIEIAASLTARYSDSKEDEVIIEYGKEKLNKQISINKIKEEEINKLRI
jgi:tRNA U34 2-thiouridine synthase MnmA/TrmU